MQLLKRKRAYSLLALFLIIAAETLFIIGSSDYNFGLFPYSFGIFAAIVLLWLLRWYIFRGNPFQVRSKILTRLMANAISPSWMGAIYLLLFIIHIGWLTNETLNLFFISSFDVNDTIATLIVSIVGIISLIEFFPEGKVEKDKGEKAKVFVSGISALISPPPSYDFERFNLTPLVKILQETEKDKEKCTILILLSDFFTADKVINNKNLKERLAVIKQTIELSGRTVSVEEFMNWPIETKLAELIKEVAKHKFPESKDWIERNLTIQFTKACDYDDFPACFKLLSKEIRRYDTRDKEICFNLTPGTASISSIVTLLSIDANRKLYYYSQDDAKKPNPIKPVDKTKVPLENLLSQALETLHDTQ